MPRGDAGRSILVVDACAHGREQCACDDERIPAYIVQGILRVKQHIDDNFAAPLTIAEACRLSAVSRTYLCHYFKRITGHSFKSYHIHVRMTKARELMNNADLAISDIAYKLGYRDLSYFSAAYKKANGSNPRSHRLSS